MGDIQKYIFIVFLFLINTTWSNIYKLFMKSSYWMPTFRNEVIK